MLINSKFDLSSSPIIRIIGAVLLFYIAYRFWTEDEHHTEEKKSVKNLKEIAIFAFVLGFAHEEEFALLAFCLDNINCMLMMISYALAVTSSLVTITLLSVYGYEKIKHKVEKYEHYLPKMSAIILFIFALLYLLKAV
jgi:threonine/homoserine/homoserine lactone efflux protein